MTKENFNWKGLFINNDDDKSLIKEQVQVAEQTTGKKFPTETTFPNSTTDSYNNPFINEILAVYEKGFESLNESGFDFFELYKSVMAVGPTNPQSYQMAFTMGKTIKSDLTKEFLLEKANFYIKEIEKVYVKYDDTGNIKKKDLSDTIIREKASLTKSISDLESKIAQLQNELETKKTELGKIDLNNKEQFSEIQLKIDANNLAKHKILDSINTVVTGVNQYL